MPSAQKQIGLPTLHAHGASQSASSCGASVSANTIGPVVDLTGPFNSGPLTTQAEPGKFRRRNFAHAGPDLHKTELAGIHHPIDGRTTDPGGLAEFGNADADARDRCMCPWPTPLLSVGGMFDRHWEPPSLSGRFPLFQKISL